MNVEGYFHTGGVVGLVSPGFSYSVGFVNNYARLRSYVKWFANKGFNTKIGVDYSYNQFELSLPYDKLATTSNFYIVTQTITVEAGNASPWFYQPGGGIQYK